MPEAACPHRCVFCNQHVITSKVAPPTEEEMGETIQTYLSTKKPTVKHVEIGFFGGSFTGLPIHELTRVLSIVQPWIKRGEIDAVRISTRPDYIDEAVLDLLKRYNVITIELGVQSFRDRVLIASGRGHTASDTEKASELILQYGFRLGHQLMVGLPGEEPGDEIFNTNESVRLGASDIRIYPVLVLKDTELANLYEKGLYKPLTLNEALEKTSRMVKVFRASGKNIIKVGLQ